MTMTNGRHPSPGVDNIPVVRAIGLKIRPVWVAASMLAVSVVWFAPPTIRAAEWRSLGPAPIASGPFAGRISAVVASPTDPDLYYVAGASGGVWRSESDGTPQIEWVPLTDDLPTCAIGALAMDPADESILYAGSGEANFANHSLYGLGLYKTTDGGDTWAVLAADTFAGRTFSRVVVSHADSQVLYASITHAGGFPARNAAKGHPQMDGPVGVFRSTDGGTSFTHLAGGLPAAPASDLAMDPVDADTLYAAIGNIFGDAQNGIYKTINGGETWTKLSGGLPTGIGRISVAVAPSSAQHVYALITNPSNATGGGATVRDVYRSIDGGATWSPGSVTGGLQATYGWYLSTIYVDPLDHNIVFAGGLTLLRSIDGGNSWSTVTPPHVDMHGLAHDAAHRLLSANDGGLHRSTTNGGNWESMNQNLGIIQFYAGLSLHPTDEDFVIGGTQDNGTNSRIDSTSSWFRVLGGDGGYTALHPSTPNTMFAEFQGSGNLYRSLNGGPFQSSRSGINTSDRHCFLPPFTYRPDSTTVLLYATHRVYRSANTGSNWTAISGDLTGGAPAAIRALVIAPSDGDTIYAATNDGRIQVSLNGGFAWSLKLTDVPGGPRVTRELAVDPLDDATAYLAVAQFGVDQVRMTTDHGDTWTAIDGDLPDVPANSMAVYNDGNFVTLFVGTDRGVYRSFTGGESWQPMGTNMPHTPVIDLVVDPSHNRIVATTLGRGAWSIPLEGSCGDGTLDASEVCDDGSTVDCDGCRADCSAVEGTCGDGNLDSICEACDDGNVIDGDGCSSQCTIEPECACQGGPGSCVCPPTIPSDPHNIRKNRFLSIVPNGGPLAFALRLELLDRTCSTTGKPCRLAADCTACSEGDNVGEGCSIRSDCPDGTCEPTTETCDEQNPPVMLGWVGEPVEAGGDALPGTFTSDIVNIQPAVRTWSESVVHIGDCEIAPVRTYGISATTNGTVFSDPLIMATIEKPQGKFWADVVGSFNGAIWSAPNGLVGVDDVLAVIKFLSLKPAPHVTVLDLVGGPPTFLNFDVNATDLQMVLVAFGGKTWPPVALTGIGYPADGDVTQCP